MKPSPSPLSSRPKRPVPACRGSVAEGSAVLRTFRGNVFSTERTQISYLAALPTTTYAAFRRERRMKFASATKFHRKSGGAEWRDLLFSSAGCHEQVTQRPT